jgi:hypothetical protein
VRIVLAGTLTVFLVGCAQLKQQQYVRTDGAPVDSAQERAVLAQCKGEGVTVTPQEPTDYFHQREAAIINACMARNGYIHPQ